MVKWFFKYLKSSNPYQYTKFDSDEEIENVHQSPPRATKLTLLEKILLVPQYMVAIPIYLDLCVLYYSASTLGGLPLAIAFMFGFFSPVATPFTLCCALFVGHFFASAMSLRLFFSNKERVRWLYDLIGEDRVRPKAFASPAIISVASKGVKAIMAIGAVDAGTHAADAAVMSGKASVDSFSNDWRFNSQRKLHYSLITDICSRPLPEAVKKTLIDQQNNTYNNQVKEYNNEATRINRDSKSRRPVGLFTSIMNAELKSQAVTEASKRFGDLFRRGN